MIIDLTNEINFNRRRHDTDIQKTVVHHGKFNQTKDHINIYHVLTCSISGYLVGIVHLLIPTDGERTTTEYEAPVRADR
jgi:hypothetical protein